MAPEYGATCGIFPVDQETLNYMRLTGRPEFLVQLTEAYFKEQGMFFTGEGEDCAYTDVLELDLGTVEPSLAGPKRPQDRLKLSEAKKNFADSFSAQLPKTGLMGKLTGGATPGVTASTGGNVAILEAPTEVENAANRSAEDVNHGAVVVAAITSCTNTSNPALMLAAGLVAKKAVEKGLLPKPWVKTSLAPGSRVATEMFKKVGLLSYLEKLHFDVVGYGCTTCIGNSGPLPQAISQRINSENLVVCSVLSGNRNFEGRINQDVKANYLMSPPLVVAYALAGTISIDLNKDPIGQGTDGSDVFLKDIWPTEAEIAEVMSLGVKRDLYVDNYADVFKGDDKWNGIEVFGTDVFEWDKDSTYIKNPPYFEGMTAEAPSTVSELVGMRCLALLGDSVTTDHISPAGAIKLNSPAGSYLTTHGVTAQMFNSYGSRRGNHEVMVRGTFANIRLRNLLAPGTEGGFSVYLPTGEVTTIYDAAVQYQQDGTPLIVIAGKEYGTGSSRDWAAKGTFMLGIKAVLAQSFERIHRSNLIGMGVLPLEFLPGESAESHKLSGKEVFDIVGLQQAAADDFKGGKTLVLRATDGDSVKEINVAVRIDTPQELLYYKNGGILQYVLRQLLGS
jgi:aconitate hydratase